MARGPYTMGQGLTTLLLLGALTSASDAQSTASPREVLILSHTKQADRANGVVDVVHECFELPLNHLGIRVHSRNFTEGPPPDVDPTRVRGVITYFLAHEPAPAWLWSWLERQAQHTSLRFVHLGALEPLGTRRARPQDALTKWLNRFGLERNDTVIEDPLQVELELSDRCCFESQPRYRRAHLGPRNRSSRNDVWMSTHLRDAPTHRNHPVITGEWGGIALAPYLFRNSTTAEEFRWFVDPFEFFRDALGLAGVPAPDPCVSFGRRVFILHIDGDGFESSSTVVHAASCATVFRDRIVDRYRFPMSISIIVRSLTDDLHVRLATPKMNLAREILNREWVEPASHAVLHPLNWRRRLTRRSIPRSVVWYPSLSNYEHSMVAEVRDSIQFINTRLLDPGRRTAVMFWSGAANPREDAILECERQDAWNLNGGTYRWDAASDSVRFVPPWGRQVGAGYQVYCGAGNENLFAGFFSTMPGAFRHIDETLERTGARRILKPVNVYAHFYSAERPARLRALQMLIKKWTTARPTIPLFASAYASAVHSAHAQCVVERTTGGWRFSRFEHCRVVRIDDETLGVDWDRSPGIVGAHRIGRALYLQLADSQAELTLATTPVTRPHLEQSDHELRDIERTANLVRCQSMSRRSRSIVFAGFAPDAPLTVIANRSTTATHADASGRFRWAIDAPGAVSLEIKTR